MDERDFELGFQLRLENVAATEKFDEVLEVAIETCLHDRSIYEASLKAVEAANSEILSNERQLVEKLGLWGLKAHIDYSEHASTFCYVVDDDLPHPLMSDMLLEPGIVPLRPDKNVQNKIEAFGTALIQEAFMCLGEDASEKAQRFGSSCDANEQYEILEWLYERIARIRDQLPEGAEQPVEVQEPTLTDSIITIIDTDYSSDVEVNSEPIVIDFRESTLSEVHEVVDSMIEVELGEEENIDLDDNGGYFYHPTRLSPKLIGVYPEVHTRTTCLGVSLLAASFFNAAGADYVHAGVMHTALDSTRMVQLMSTNTTIVTADELGFRLNNAAEKALLDIEDSLYKLRRSDSGHHAVSIVKLTDGSWVYFDPNYIALDRFHEVDNADTNKMFEALQSIERVDRSVSLIHRNSEGRYSDFFIWAIDDLYQLQRDHTAEQLDAIMASENVIDGLKDYLLGVAAELSTYETIFNFMVACTKEGDKESYADKVFSHVIDKYFLAGMEPDAIAERCKTDPAFRARRIEDLHMLPYMMILRSISEFSSYLTRGVHAPAALLEVGMPAFRLGACVLSDFSVYVGNEVPLSFWVANWPSHVAVEGHLPDQNDDRAQAELGRRMSSIIRCGLLRHFTSYGIIHKFLEQGVEKTDGDQQG